MKRVFFITTGVSHLCVNLTTVRRKGQSFDFPLLLRYSGIAFIVAGFIISGFIIFFKLR
jgi:Na+-transporting NADH:ubiquinone oxidoreductase subunit NqrE